MTLSVSMLGPALQTLFTETADQAARDAGFSQRRRKITGAGFVQCLVFGWLNQPDATLEDLAAPLDASDQALQKRFSAKAADCLQRVLQKAMGHLFESRRETIPLLGRFTAVSLEDSTTVRLPAALAATFPGCGGSDSQAGQAGLKVMVRFDALTGNLQMAMPRPARDSDRALIDQLPPLPRGSLRLADLGFFDLKKLAWDAQQGLFWISRVPAKLSVRVGDDRREALACWLASQKSDRLDGTVTLGTEDQLTCRLVAVRVPATVAATRLKRLQRKLKKKGRSLSQAQRVMCQWMVMITTLEAPRYSAETLWALYGVRWQVELLFKRWKSGGGLAASRGRTGHRVLCEAYAKLLAMVIQHWATLLRGGPLSAVSATRACRRVRWWAGRLAEALSVQDGAAVLSVLERLKRDLERVPKKAKRRRPSTRQTLFKPRFAA